MFAHRIKIDYRWTLSRQNKVACLHVAMTDSATCQLLQQRNNRLDRHLRIYRVLYGLPAQLNGTIPWHVFRYIPRPATQGTQSLLDQGDRPGGQDTVHPEPVSIFP